MAPLGTIQNPNVGIHPPGFRLPPTSHVGRVRLAVSDLERSVSFYTKIVGLSVLKQADQLAQLGVSGSSQVLLELEWLPGIHAIDRRTRLGLYHSAFLLPDRGALSSFIAHLVSKGINFGSGDHLYSEAIYLVDPDGLSVEIYADRSRDQWVYDGQEIVSATNPVKFEDLLAMPRDPWRGMPEGTVIGHVHMYVGDLDQAVRFYHAALGFDIVTWRYPGALFISAGGYHHDVAVNVWAAGSPPASSTDARLLFWELVLPNEAVRSRAQMSLTSAGYKRAKADTDDPSYVDPWGIQVTLTLEQA
jgi:catechol 2,3-dioxygenase